MLLCSDTINQFNVLVKGQEDDVNRLKVSRPRDERHSVIVCSSIIITVIISIIIIIMNVIDRFLLCVLVT